MYYEGMNYLDDNNFMDYEGRISIGDEERLSHIARMNNMFTLNVNSIIRHVIREYYKDHNVAAFIKETTGTEYKEYEEFLEIMKKSFD